MPISLRASACVRASLFSLYIEGRRSRATVWDLVVLECRKAGAPGQEFLFLAVHTTGARLNEVLGVCRFFCS